MHPRSVSVFNIVTDTKYRFCIYYRHRHRFSRFHKDSARQPWKVFGHAHNNHDQIWCCLQNSQGMSNVRTPYLVMSCIDVQATVERHVLSFV